MSEPSTPASRVFTRALIISVVFGLLVATYGALFEGEVITGLGLALSWLITFVTTSVCGIFIVSMIRMWVWLFAYALKRKKP
ncbi:MAG: hypothetical protein K2W95_35030 [Candidatus Obscuribacterales bacterium]|nr:hypothetical protein [Candidatus Obscuribacterales bacterium]